MTAFVLKQTLRWLPSRTLRELRCVSRCLLRAVEHFLAKRQYIHLRCGLPCERGTFYAFLRHSTCGDSVVYASFPAPAQHNLRPGPSYRLWILMPQKMAPPCGPSLKSVHLNDLREEGPVWEAQSVADLETMDVLPDARESDIPNPMCAPGIHHVWEIPSTGGERRCMLSVYYYHMVIRFVGPPWVLHHIGVSESFIARRRAYRSVLPTGALERLQNQLLASLDYDSLPASECAREFLHRVLFLGDDNLERHKALIDWWDGYATVQHIARVYGLSRFCRRPIFEKLARLSI